MSPFFRKRADSPVRILITTLRASVEKLKQLDDAEKEKLAEPIRGLMQIQANLAYTISKTDRREGKKLTLEADKDETEVKRFLTELGVGRYSPENQQKIDEAIRDLATLVEEARQVVDRAERRSAAARPRDSAS